jgi:hypothetical protein
MGLNERQRDLLVALVDVTPAGTTVFGLASTVSLAPDQVRSSLRHLYLRGLIFPIATEWRRLV